jgi:glycosyltransferase involved in cell wall biosynthesis
MHHEIPPTRPLLSLVIPVYNEAENIVPLVQEIVPSLEGRGEYEIIVVDDGSDDDTLARLQILRAGGETRLRILRHPRNLGKSAALRNGVGAAHGEWVATLDGDGQNDPADIPRLCEVLADCSGEHRLRLVCGHRVRRDDPWLKRLSSRIANAVRGRLLGDAVPDTGCGLKLIHRQAFLDLPFFDHMHRFLPALIERGGGTVVSVEVSHRPRLHGESKYGVHNRLWVGITDLFGVLWLKRRAKNLICEEVN